MVARYSVGSVPYLNAKPLVKPLVWAGEDSGVAVEFAVPSRLPAMLDSGQVQAIMVSSIAALQDPLSTVAAGLSISTQRTVLSVRLFSKVPFAHIRTLAEDQSSMTSNALARLVLTESYGVRPIAFPLPPDGAAMLDRCDACVMIGDNGMRFEGVGLHILDLGEAWYQLTELPFVWAVWKGRDALTPELTSHLQNSLREAREQMDRVIREAAAETGFIMEQCRHYLLDIMDYRLDEQHLLGLSKFGELLVKHGLLNQVHMPHVVGPD
jgi:chorismate dehydratase